jgi:hypothetical protein
MESRRGNSTQPKTVGSRTHDANTKTILYGEGRTFFSFFLVSYLLEHFFRFFLVSYLLLQLDASLHEQMYCIFGKFHQQEEMEE